MKKLKKILHRLLFPGAAVVILSVPVGTGLLLYTFFSCWKQQPDCIGVLHRFCLRYSDCLCKSYSHFPERKWMDKSKSIHSPLSGEHSIQNANFPLLFTVDQFAVCRRKRFFRNLLLLSMVWLFGGLLYLFVRYAVFPSALYTSMDLEKTKLPSGSDTGGVA